jgi:hypothetical protein
VKVLLGKLRKYHLPGEIQGVASQSKLYLMNHNISVNTAKTMTERFRAYREAILAAAYQGQDLFAFAETFDRTAIAHLVNHPACASIRIYYGMDESLRVHAILVGVSESGSDILPEDPEVATEDVVEMGNRCPPNCYPSVLNP